MTVALEELKLAFRQSAAMDEQITVALANLNTTLTQMLEQRAKALDALRAALGFIQKHDPISVKKRQEQLEMIKTLQAQLGGAA